MSQPAITFGTDGIRGEYGAWPMRDEDVRAVAQAVAEYFRREADPPRFVIGRDTRQSSLPLAQVVAEGLSTAGALIEDVGVIPTAGLAYLAVTLNKHAGIMITASHNPWQENGIKVIGGDGFKLADETEHAIEALIGQPGSEGSRGLLVNHPQAVDDYIQHLIHPFAGTSLAGLKIALDCSHGAASLIAPAAFRALGADPISLSASPDGRNINAGCGSEAVRVGQGELVERARTGDLDMAFAFDGDADRVIALDEAGELMDGDHLLLLLAAYLNDQGRLRGNVVVTTQMANRGLDRALAMQGIETIRTPVGDRYIIQQITGKGYTLGGEQSGHIVIYDPQHTTGDGIYTALMLAHMRASGWLTSFAEWRRKLIKFPQVIASARVGSRPDLDSLADLDSARTRIAATLGADGLINIRYSGTEPLVRVMIESGTEFSPRDLADHALSLCRIVQAASGSPDGAVEIKDTATGNPVGLN
jgi:phosphoglucosamine mutase